MNTKSILASAAVLGLALGITACGAEQPEEVEVVADTDCAPGIEVRDAWLALAAVEGNPAAVYFDIENTGATSRMIRSASVLGFGSAALHQTSEYNFAPSMDELMQVEVPAGETLAFEPETMHVMGMSPDNSLEVTDETEATLTFVGGDKCSFPVEVRAAGDAPADEAE
ncbi:MAG: copper chaperone PCu(A)C [Alteraurantiacibacter sp.]